MPLLTGHFSDKQTPAMLRSMHGGLEWHVMLHEFAVGVVLVKRYNVYWKKSSGLLHPSLFLPIPTTPIYSYCAT